MDGSLLRARPPFVRLSAFLTALATLLALPGMALAVHRAPQHHGHHRRRQSASRASVAARPGRARRPACPGAHTRIRTTSRTDLRRAVVCLLDHERRAHGLPGLRTSSPLDLSAQRWTNTMVRHRDFSHGSDFSARISTAGFDWSRVGENIATGFRTPAGAVRAWMRSTGHCQNILNPMFREAGTGVDAAPAASRISPGTWTLDLGLGLRQHARSGDWSPAAGCPYRG